MPRWPSQTNRSAEERFWEKVQKLDGEDACWIWTAHRHNKGYGVFSDRTKHIVKAHRFSWELAHGLIPDGMMVCHRCDNPPCVRPDHLFLGNNSDNQRDAVSKGRFNTQVHPECVNTARLTPVQVREIRAAYRPYFMTCKMLANRYGVSAATIKNVVGGTTWKHSGGQRTQYEPARHPSECSGNRKLTRDAARAIRAMWATGKYTQAEIGQRFGLSKSGVNHVLKGKTWPESV